MQVVDASGNMFGYDHLEIIGLDGKPKTPGGGGGPYVPYTGATGDVDLGEYELKAGQVEFDQTPTGTAGVAVMRWNDQDGTVDLGLKGGNVTLQVGQEQVTRVVNKTGSDLLEANYQAVRISGAQGNRLKVDLAQANNDANSADTLGLVTETINNNLEGFITTSGLVRNIDTTGSLQGETWTDGDMLYLSGITAGQITNVKPTAPIHTIIMGYVVRAHATQGQIYVKVDNGYELDELHNVAITSPTNGQVLTYDSSTSLWKNAAAAGGSVSPIDIQLFTASGVWTKPANAKMVEIHLVSGGGGGASGRRGAMVTARYGGGAGSSGTLQAVRLDASTLGATENVWIGAGGAGALGQANNDTNGNNGANGAASFFGGTGTLASAKLATNASVGGIGGSAAVQSGTSNFPSYLFGMSVLSLGYTSGTVGPGNFGGANDSFQVRALQSGNIGGGINTSDVRFNGRGILTTGPQTGNVINNRNGGNTVGGAGIDGFLITNNPNNLYIALGGTGGAPGDTAGTVAGGKGGDGGPGAGGGGGGASTNGVASGAGGRGGNGFCMVITYF